MSKIASGYGMLYCWRLSYKPVPGDLEAKINCIVEIHNVNRISLS